MHWSVQKCTFFDLFACVFLSEFSLPQKLMKLSVLRSPKIQRNTTTARRFTYCSLANISLPWRKSVDLFHEHSNIAHMLKSLGSDLWCEKKNIQACFNLNFLLKAKVNKSDLMDQTVARASIKDDRYRVIIWNIFRNILVKHFIWACWRVMRRFFLKTCRDYGKEKFGRVTDREGFKEVFVLLEICR